MKKDSKGYKSTWVGYKLHLDVADGQIPISCLLTSASLHDSQAAIPLATLSAERTTNLYDLMDAAYDAEPIRQHSRSLGHVPLIDTNPRRDKALAEELRTEARRLQTGETRPGSPGGPGLTTSQSPSMRIAARCCLLPSPHERLWLPLRRRGRRLDDQLRVPDSLDLHARAPSRCRGA